MPWRSRIVRTWQLDFGNPIEISALYGRLGDKEHAQEWLDKAYRMKEMGLAATPWFDCLTRDPAYEARLENLGILPPRDAA